MFISHRVRFPFPVAAVLCCALALPVAAPVLAHEGHDHEEEAPPAATPVDAARPTNELSSELYEALILDHGDHLDIYLDRYDTNEPVTGAKLSVEVGDAAAVLAEEETPAMYTLSITPLAPGAAVPITLTISAAPGDDLLGGTLENPVEAEVSLGSRLGAWWAAGWPWGLGLILLAVVVVVGRRLLGQRSSSVAALFLSLAALGVPGERAFAHEGHDHEEEAMPAATAAAPAGSGDRPMRLPDGSVFVPKATQRIIAIRTQIATAGPSPVSVRLAGEIVGDPRASAQLQTLQGGRIVSSAAQWPTLGARVRRGQVLLRLTPSGSGGERAATAVDGARVDSELAQARADLARLEGLPGVVSRAEVEQARSRVQSLAAQRSALAAPLGGGEALVSPIDGVIASIDARAGAVVAPGETLLTVIDPARLSVEALAFDAIPGGAASITGASVALRDGTRLEARLEGIGSQLKGGAIPVRLNLTSVSAGLAVGQPVVVYLERSVTTPGLPLPSDALVRTPNGDRVVFEKISAERYVPRTVRVRQVAADRIAVLEGVEPGGRIVVSGAALLAQIR
jgi:cobalt-zinc-cadmium efflux system membrane fusion protein